MTYAFLCCIGTASNRNTTCWHFAGCSSKRQRNWNSQQPQYNMLAFAGCSSKRQRNSRELYIDQTRESTKKCMQFLIIENQYWAIRSATSARRDAASASDDRIVLVVMSDGHVILVLEIVLEIFRGRGELG